MSKRYTPTEVRNLLKSQREEILSRFGSPGGMGGIGQGYVQPGMMYFGKELPKFANYFNEIEFIFDVFKTRPGTFATLRQFANEDNFKKFENVYMRARQEP